jgi:polysaccharide biosynthesis transport protein
MPEVPQYIFAQQSAPLQSSYEPAGPVTYDDDQHLDLWSYWRTIEHHRMLILILLIAVPLLTAIGVSLATPLYMGKSVILIQRETPQLLDTKEAARGADDLPDNEHDFYKTEDQILKSRELAATVIKDMDLANNPAFLSQTRPSKLATCLHSIIAKVTGNHATGSQTGIDSRAALLGVSPSLIDGYLSYLQIGPVPGTRLVNVEFVSPDATLASNVANAHMLSSSAE